jgi:hypothetical protein
VLLPASEPSSGIWTLSRGLAPPPTLRLLDRDGGVNVVSGMEGTELRDLARLDVFERCGIGGDVLPLARDTVPTSTDCDRFSASSLARRSVSNDAKC